MRHRLVIGFLCFSLALFAQEKHPLAHVLEITGMDDPSAVAEVDGQPLELQENVLTRNDCFLHFAAGWPQTMLSAQYSVSDRRGNHFALRADHDAQWGFRTLEWSALSLDYSHRFRRTELYAQLGGANLFFTRYGRYWSDSLSAYTIPTRYSALRSDDRQAIWRATASLGFRSPDADQPLQYRAEMLYQYYGYQGLVGECQFDLRFDIDYRIGNHRVGNRFYCDNQFILLSDSAAGYYETNGLHLTPKHCVRLEPFYAFSGHRLSLHVGVHLDINVGKGNLFSLTDDHTPLAKQVSFAPSPSVRMEAKLSDRTTLFADVLGNFGTGSVTGYVRLNPYINVIGAPASHHVSGYTPVDARLGFRSHPVEGLSLRLDAGYRYVLNSVECTVSESTDPGYQWRQMGLIYVDYQRWRTGLELQYNYKEYFSMRVTADGFFYRHIQHNTSGIKVGGTTECYTPGRIYDKPLWEIAARLDGHIDCHWTLYSDNLFKDGRWAITSMGDRRLPYYIEMNLGAEYAFVDTGHAPLNGLRLFAELQNLLNRRNAVWYGYESEGIRARLGLHYKW